MYLSLIKSDLHFSVNYFVNLKTLSPLENSRFNTRYLKKIIIVTKDIDKHCWGKMTKTKVEDRKSRLVCRKIKNIKLFEES